MPILGPILKIVVVTAGVLGFLKWLEEPCDFCGLKNDAEGCSDASCEKNSCRNCGGYVEVERYKEWLVSNGGFYCPGHLKERKEEIQRLKNAIDKSEGVEVFSKNYRGRTPPTTQNRWIATKSYRNRDDASRELKILAALEGCDAVIKAEFIREETSDSENPNYVYSMWKYKGLI